MLFSSTYVLSSFHIHEILYVALFTLVTAFELSLLRVLMYLRECYAVRFFF